MERREKLVNYLCKNNDDEQLIVPLIDELLFLEDRLTSLKKLPFIKVHPSNPECQKVTPASKQYKELLQQYTNIIKVLDKNSSDESNAEKSPLRDWVKSQMSHE